MHMGQDRFLLPYRTHMFMTSACSVIWKGPMFTINGVEFFLGGGAVNVYDCILDGKGEIQITHIMLLLL